jgi:hypothetical protein
MDRVTIRARGHGAVGFVRLASGTRCSLAKLRELISEQLAGEQMLPKPFCFLSGGLVVNRAQEWMEEVTECEVFVQTSEAYESKLSIPHDVQEGQLMAPHRRTAYSSLVQHWVDMFAFMDRREQVALGLEYPRFTLLSTIVSTVPTAPLHHSLQVEAANFLRSEQEAQHTLEASASPCLHPFSSPAVRQAGPTECSASPSKYTASNMSDWQEEQGSQPPDAPVKEGAGLEGSSALTTSLNERVELQSHSVDKEAQRREQEASRLHALLSPSVDGRLARKHSSRLSPRAASPSGYSSPSVSKGQASFENGTLSSTLRKFATEEEARSTHSCYLRSGDFNAASVNKFIQEITSRGSGLQLSPRPTSKEVHLSRSRMRRPERSR